MRTYSRLRSTSLLAALAGAALVAACTGTIGGDEDGSSANGGNNGLPNGHHLPSADGMV